MVTDNNMKSVNYSFENTSLQAVVSGNEDRKDNVVLCLHGWLDNAASFSPLIPYFQQGLPEKHIVAIDWPGHGHSIHRSLDAHYHFIDWVYDLLQLFELNNWQQVDIVAHSMGGMVASAFAAAFPEKVKSLTLIDSIGFINTIEKKTTKQLRDGMLSRFKGSRLNIEKKGTKKKNYYQSIDSAIKARVNFSDLSYELAKLIVERGIIKELKGYRWRSDERLRNISPYRLSLKQAQQLIFDIECPVQLIYATNGLDMVRSGMKDFKVLFKKITLVELVGGHHVHMEQPQRTAELIQHFIAK